MTGEQQKNRRVKNKWLVYSDKPQSDETAFGIVRHDGNMIYEIHSLYKPKRLSNRERTKYISRFVKSRLAADEYAKVTVCNGKFFPTQELGVSIFTTGYRTKFFENASLLYIDALRRKSSISKVFSEPIQYIPQGVFRKGGGKSEQEAE